MSEKLYLKDIVTHLIKDSVKRLFEGEQGNYSTNAFVYNISKEGWEHKLGFHQCLYVRVLLENENCVSCEYGNPSSDEVKKENHPLGGKTSILFYKEKNEFVEKVQNNYALIFSYSDLPMFELTNTLLKEAIESWCEKMPNNHIAPFADEAVNEPHQWLKIKKNFNDLERAEDSVLGAFDNTMKW